MISNVVFNQNVFFLFFYIFFFKRSNPQSHLSTVRHNFITSTGPVISNLIPSRIKEAQTLDSFKNQLDRFYTTFRIYPQLLDTQRKTKILSWSGWLVIISLLMSYVRWLRAGTLRNVSHSRREDLRFIPPGPEELPAPNLIQEVSRR